jgi:large subunit ribosomal protein L21
MTYAIIATGGKQYRVEVGRFYDIELLSAQPQDKITIDQVLLINQDGNIHIGQPFVQDAQVEATVLEHRRAKKVIIYKMKPKKKTRRKNGHRQPLTRIMIDDIKVAVPIAA